MHLVFPFCMHPFGVLSAWGGAWLVDSALRLGTRLASGLGPERCAWGLWEGGRVSASGLSLSAAAGGRERASGEGQGLRRGRERDSGEGLSAAAGGERLNALRWPL